MRPVVCTAQAGTAPAITQVYEERSLLLEGHASLLMCLGGSAGEMSRAVKGCGLEVPEEKMYEPHR